MYDTIFYICLQNTVHFKLPYLSSFTSSCDFSTSAEFFVTLIPCEAALVFKFTV